jgi:hypothetical protein
MALDRFVCARGVAVTGVWGVGRVFVVGVVDVWGWG